MSNHVTSAEVLSALLWEIVREALGHFQTLECNLNSNLKTQIQSLYFNAGHSFFSFWIHLSENWFLFIVAKNEENSEEI